MNVQHKNLEYVNELTFEDSDNTTCEIYTVENDGRDCICLYTLGEFSFLTLSKNQAKDMVTVLNYWVENNQLPPKKINFKPEPPNTGIY